MRKKHVFETAQCSGCHKNIVLGEVYHEVLLTYTEYVKHIALCKKCYKSAVQQGVQFNDISVHN